jgi:uncharacterized membrane protein YfcA
MNYSELLTLVGIGLVSFVLSYIGAAVGMVLGHLRLPLLVAVLGSPVSGASTNLAVSGLGALAGSIPHFRSGRISLRAVMLVGIPSALGAIVGMLLFVKLGRFWAHLTLGLLLLVLGIRMLRRPAQQTSSESTIGSVRVTIDILIGLLLGAIAAVTGLMMNGLRLPLLIRHLRGDVSVAVGTNMAVGCLTALVGVLTAWLVGSGFDVLALLIVGPPTVLGSYLGAGLTGRLSKQALQRALGWVITILGFVMVVEGFWRTTRPRDLQPPPQTLAEAQSLEEETDEWFDEPDWEILLGDPDDEPP